jgi:sugar lactone lactonase YvrE
MNINNDTKWIQNGNIIVGRYGQGYQLNQLYYPKGIYIDDNDQTIYIADSENNRIVEWKWGDKNGRIVAGGNGQGLKIDQLKWPRDVIIDKINNSFIISDYGNERIMRYSRTNTTKGQIIISNINCSHLKMDENNGDIYISDCENHEVRRWKIGEINGTIVAGGNGKGNHLNQLNEPTYIFIDQNHSIYISDTWNHRVIKWIKDAKEGIIVAGGQNEGNSLTQLSYPQGILVDHLDNVYIADAGNHRIMRWLKGSCEGSIVVGGNGCGQQTNQFNYLEGLAFDQQGNIFVVDVYNSRVLKFDIDSN